jgi:hypothetical protein
MLPQLENWCFSVLLFEVKVVIEKKFSYIIRNFFASQIFFSRGAYFLPQTPKSASFSPPSRGGKVARIYTPGKISKF